MSNRIVPAAVAALLAVSPLLAAETIFKGRDIEISKAFMCGGKERAAGRYGLEVQIDEKEQGGRLSVFKGNDVLCDVPGEPSGAGVGMASNKVRILTRVNAEKGAIQLDLVVPSSVRAKYPNQVFYLPLTKKG